MSQGLCSSTNAGEQEDSCGKEGAGPGSKVYQTGSLSDSR